MPDPFDIANVPPPVPVEIAGTDNPHIAWRLIRDLSHSVSSLGEGETVRVDKVTAAIEMAKNLEPKDALEAQMIAQMIAAHRLRSR